MSTDDCVDMSESSIVECLVVWFKFRQKGRGEVVSTLFDYKGERRGERMGSRFRFRRGVHGWAGTVRDTGNYWRT